MRRFKGYMTLEAALIIPAAVCVIVMVIWGTYFVYNRAILSQDCYVLAFKASRCGNEKIDIDPKGYVAKKAAEQIGTKYFGSSRPAFSAKASAKEVSVAGKTRINTNAMGKYYLKMGHEWGLEASLKAKITDNPKHLRRIKRLKDLGENFK